MHSDQGRDFEGKLIHELFDLLGVEKSRTTPYHPQGDPQPERFNRTLLDMLGTLDVRQKTHWSRHIGHLVHNCSLNEATGYSPYFLMFGREARLPIDLSFGVSSDGTSTKSYRRFVNIMQQELKSAYELAEESAGKKNAGNKRRYDQRLHYCHLAPGDRVLIRNLGLQGKHKLADRWSTEPYIVQSQMPHLPVFRLKSESGNGPVKILHRNHMILPIGQELRQRQVPDSVLTPKRRTLRRRKNADHGQIPGQKLKDALEIQEAERVDLNDNESSDSETEMYRVCFPKPQARQLTPAEIETTSDSVVFEPVHDNVERFDEEIGVLQRAETDESVESSSRLLLENISDNLLNVNQETNAASSVQDQLCIDQSEGHNTISDNVLEMGKRPQRDKVVPKRFTYDTLGVPKWEPVHARAKVVNPVRYCSTVYLLMNVPSKLSAYTVKLK
nr:uncharacterized protein LOC129447547 [Misgurnus anguillicaudatus]